MDYNKLALELHEKYKGKITTSLRDKEELNRDKLSAYTALASAQLAKQFPKIQQICQNTLGQTI